MKKVEVKLEPRTFDRIEVPVRLLGQYNPKLHFDISAGEPSLRWFRRWCINYALTNYDIFLQEIGPAATDVTKEILCAFKKDTSGHRYERPSWLPELQDTSPSWVVLALAPTWIALGIGGLSYTIMPLELAGQGNSSYWTFVFKEKDGRWSEHWRQDMRLNSKGGLWLPGDLYFPSDRYPWPLPVKFPGQYTDIGKLNNSLVPKSNSSFTERLRSSLPWVRYKARMHAKALAEQREKLAPRYEALKQALV
jgi:hypothetical protein